MSQPYAMVRGRVIRVTALDSCGGLLPEGEASYVVSSAVTSVNVTEKTYSHAAQTESDPYDRLVYVPTERIETVGFNVDLTLTKVDPQIVNIVSGNPMFSDGSEVFGFGADAHVAPTTFALEIWSKIAGGGCDGYGYGYTLFPRLTGGRLSGVSFVNGLVDLELIGASCLRGASWGAGPYDPEFGFGLGPFGVTPMGGEAETSGLDMTSHNRFWVNHLVGGHPGPQRFIPTPGSM